MDIFLIFFLLCAAMKRDQMKHKAVKRGDAELKNPSHPPEYPSHSLSVFAWLSRPLPPRKGFSKKHSAPTRRSKRTEKEMKVDLRKKIKCAYVLQLA